MFGEESKKSAKASKLSGFSTALHRRHEAIKEPDEGYNDELTDKINQKLAEEQAARFNPDDVAAKAAKANEATELAFDPTLAGIDSEEHTETPEGSAEYVAPTVKFDEDATSTAKAGTDDADEGELYREITKLDKEEQNAKPSEAIPVQPYTYGMGEPSDEKQYAEEKAEEDSAHADTIESENREEVMQESGGVTVDDVTSHERRKTSMRKPNLGKKPKKANAAVQEETQEDEIDVDMATATSEPGIFGTIWSSLSLLAGAGICAVVGYQCGALLLKSLISKVLGG